MDIRTTVVAGLVCVCGGNASGQLRVAALPAGYMPGQIAGVSDGGSVVAASLTRLDMPLATAFVLDGSGWRDLGGTGDRSFALGLSADGRAVLSADVGGEGLVLDRDGVRTVIAPGWAGVGGSLSRDGSAVFYGRVSPDGRPRIERWSDGITSTPLVLGDGYFGVPEVIAGAGSDAFVFRAGISDDATGAARSAVVAGGVVTEIPTLHRATFVRSWATAANADASVVVGLEQAWDRSDDPDRYATRAWAYRGGSLLEISVNGFTDLIPTSVSDDGSLILAQGVTTDAYGYEMLDGLLLHSDGRTDLVSELLMDAGLTLGLGEWALPERLSADGRTVAGTIQWVDAFGGPSYSYFTLAVPAPGGVSALVLAGLLSARRRR